MMMLIRSAYDWWIAKLRAIRHSKPPEPPMRLRLHEAGHAVVDYRFGYTQQGIMLREDDTGETSQQYATGMDDDMSVRLQTETIISMAGFAVTLEYPEYRTDALRIGGDVQSELVHAAIIHRIDPAMGSTDEIMDSLWVRARLAAGNNRPLIRAVADRLHSLGTVLFEGDRSEFEEPDSGNLDLRGITPDPVREKMRELGLRMERDDSHDSNGDDSDEEYWCKYDQGELRDLHRSRLALYAHVDRTAGTVAIVDVETGEQATLGFDKLLKLNRVEYGKRRACS